ncbi:PREDICTED: short-chain dehydrogenase reductase 3b-like [Nelumbo nucifera]|uniref:Short-chain dehydrogenase reductase 3b-like n=1 Tax=Nelumbo nucifera TaxID=4432 RepID=A0A1U7Z5V3_NELNU|nr:PREDICTED: short-chain dehydrogenase reductase 3b-like [Nelumbo nucifera]
MEAFSLRFDIEDHINNTSDIGFIARMKKLLVPQYGDFLKSEEMLIDGFRYRNSSSGGNPSSGIGKATVRLFVVHVCLVVIIANVQDELGQRVAASIGTDRCIYIHCDITDEDQVKSMVERTVRSYGHLDIMFSNAGIFNNHQGILDLDLIACDHLFAVNVRGMAACVKHAAQSMVDTGVKGSTV